MSILLEIKYSLELFYLACGCVAVIISISFAEHQFKGFIKKTLPYILFFILIIISVCYFIEFKKNTPKTDNSSNDQTTIIQINNPTLVLDLQKDLVKLAELHTDTDENKINLSMETINQIMLKYFNESDTTSIIYRTDETGIPTSEPYKPRDFLRMLFLMEDVSGISCFKDLIDPNTKKLHSIKIYVKESKPH